MLSRSSALFILLGLIVAAVAPAAYAEPIYFAGTGHYYERVETTTDWQTARDLAEGLTFMGMQGRLATITSQAENDFLQANFAAGWIGGFQVDGAQEPDGGWRWITDESFTFTSWGETEPNNNSGDPTNPNERFLVFEDVGTWNDLNDRATAPAFLVEYAGAVPEPSSFVLSGLGVLGALGYRKFGRKAA
jgi:hypothetical protein